MVIIITANIEIGTVLLEAKRINVNLHVSPCKQCGKITAQKKSIRAGEIDIVFFI